MVVQTEAAPGEPRLDRVLAEPEAVDAQKSHTREEFCCLPPVALDPAVEIQPAPVVPVYPVVVPPETTVLPAAVAAESEKPVQRPLAECRLPGRVP